jgi:hypothetical protein
MGVNYVLDDYTLQFEELNQNRKADGQKPKLRFLVFNWLFSDVDITEGFRPIHMDSDEDLNEQV